ncbi:MAG TPA: methyl-accepting chemotaxis protein, partial [Burkholderiaceae bacterium]
GGGMAQATRAGGAMQQVVEAVERVNAIMADISRASNEQSIGIDQVNQAIAHLDQVTQQNAKLVETAAESAGSLAQQAHGLTQAVGVFKVRGAAKPRLAVVPSARRSVAVQALRA